MTGVTFKAAASSTRHSMALGGRASVARWSPGLGGDSFQSYLQPTPNFEPFLPMRRGKAPSPNWYVPNAWGGRVQEPDRPADQSGMGRHQSDERTQHGYQLDQPDMVQHLAAALVTDSYVEGSVGTVPVITGDLLADVREICGLTADQIAFALGLDGQLDFDIMSADGVPEPLERVLSALRAIGLTLIRGLGSAGVARWLTAPPDPRLARIRAGRIEDVAQEALQYRVSIAT